MRGRRSRVLLAQCVLLMLFAAGCTIDTEGLATPAAPGSSEGPARSPGPDGSTLPVLGPTTNTHWHAAYIVRVCDRVLDPFDSDSDPVGVHSHGDGLIHIHPFVDEAARENAQLGLFADAMGFGLSTGELTLPDGGVWRDGDLCDGVPGRVFVDRWAGPGSDGQPERIFETPDRIRFEADRELYQIAFAPVDSPPVVPPSEPQLDQVSAPVVADEPWVDVGPDADVSTVRVWAVEATASTPCAAGAVEERVLSGEPRCFTPEAEVFGAADAFMSARAVTFDRRAAVEVALGPALTNDLDRRFAAAASNEAPDTVTYAIEADGAVLVVVTTAVFPFGRDRLVIHGGFSDRSALALAALLDAGG